MNTTAVARAFAKDHPDFEGELRVEYTDASSGKFKASVHWIVEGNTKAASYQIATGEGNGICESCGRIFLDSSIYFTICEMGVAHVCNKCRLKLGLYRTTEAKLGNYPKYSKNKLQLPFNLDDRSFARAIVRYLPKENDVVETMISGEPTDDDS